MVSKISLPTCRHKRRRIHQPKTAIQLPKIDTEAAQLKADIYGMYVGILDQAVCMLSPIDRRGQLHKFRATLNELIAESVPALEPGEENSTTLLLEVVEKILCITCDEVQRRQLVKTVNSLRGMYNHYLTLSKESLPAAPVKGLPLPAAGATGVQQTRPRPPARA